MGLSIYNIKKWILMFTGRSISHVNQDMGKMFTAGTLNGYFNNLTEKVIKEPELLNTNNLPINEIENGEKILFPVTIFQYGLGCYDLFLSTGEEKYINKFFQCAEWAVQNQEESGAWNNFYFIYPDHPYGAMCQGEGASLLIRAFKESEVEKYRISAKRALEFMLLDKTNGGTASYDNNGLILLEYEHLPAVLNGWVFALFGLYDYCLIDKDTLFEKAFVRTTKTLKEYMYKFDCGYWSLYNLRGMMTSPFYHSLHIAQMHALELILNDDFFGKYEEKFSIYQKSSWNTVRAIVIKIIQKVKE